MAGYDAGHGLSSSTKGTGRELFISTFLSQCLPPHYRFSSGDIVDRNDNQSGQVDIIIESPYLYSFPFHLDGPRLFPAESVGVAIEVKSDVSNQWDEVKATVEKIRCVKKTSRKTLYKMKGDTYKRLSEWTIKTQDTPERLIDEANKFYDQSENAPTQREDIPIYVVGYKGWKTLNTIEEKRAELELDGLIVLDELKSSFAEPMQNGANSRSSIMMVRNFSDESTLWHLLDVIDKHVKDTIDQFSLMQGYFDAKDDRTFGLKK